MTATVTAGALRAALEAATRFGLEVEEHTILHDGCNLVVRLEPGGLVVRVATLTAEIRGTAIAEFFAREVALGAHLAACGAPIAPPCDSPPAGPHQVDGYWLTFWRYIDHDPARSVAPEAMGRTLRAMHEGLRTFPGQIPLLAPLEEADAILDRLEASGGLPMADLAMLRASRRRLQPVYEAAMRQPLQALHGDPHRHNLLRTPTGPLWTDFEDTVYGPIAWDLACFAAASRFWGPAEEEVERALAAYGADGVVALDDWIEIRAFFVLCWHAARVAGQAGRDERLAARLAFWRARGG